MKILFTIYFMVFSYAYSHPDLFVDLNVSEKVIEAERGSLGAATELYFYFSNKSDDVQGLYWKKKAILLGNSNLYISDAIKKILSSEKILNKEGTIELEAIIFKKNSIYKNLSIDDFESLMHFYGESLLMKNNYDGFNYLLIASDMGSTPTMNIVVKDFYKRKEEEAFFYWDAYLRFFVKNPKNYPDFKMNISLEVRNSLEKKAAEMFKSHVNRRKNYYEVWLSSNVEKLFLSLHDNFISKLIPNRR